MGMIGYKQLCTIQYIDTFQCKKKKKKRTTGYTVDEWIKKKKKYGTNAT